MGLIKRPIMFNKSTGGSKQIKYFSPESAIFSFKSKPSFHSNLPIKIRINFINNNYIFIQ